MKMEQLILDNDRDRRAAQWLIQTVGQEAVNEAIQKLAGNRKPYISNVAKILGLEIPKLVILTPQETAREKIAEIRAILRGKKSY
jgi:cryptic plasmid protein A